jgi:hypothetical protein
LTGIRRPESTTKDMVKRLNLMGLHTQMIQTLIIIKTKKKYNTARNVISSGIFKKHAVELSVHSVNSREENR